MSRLNVGRAANNSPIKRGHMRKTGVVLLPVEGGKQGRHLHGFGRGGDGEARALGSFDLTGSIDAGEPFIGRDREELKTASPRNEGKILLQNEHRVRAILDRRAQGFAGALGEASWPEF